MHNNNLSPSCHHAGELLVSEQFEAVQASNCRLQAWEGGKYKNAEIVHKTPDSPVILTISKTITNALKKRRIWDGFGLSEGYKKLVSKLDTDLSAFIETCGKFGYQYECINGHHKYKPVHCKKIHYCVECGQIYSESEYQAIYDVFQDIAMVKPKMKIIAQVFTIPDKYWNEINYGDKITKFCRVVYQTIKKYFRKMTKRKGLLLAGHISLHLWGDIKPDIWKPHVDLVMCNVAYDPEKNYIVGVNLDPNSGEMIKTESKGGFVYVNPYIDVDKMREIYKNELKRHFGWNINTIDIHSEYMTWDRDEAKIRHRIKYSTRMPQMDIIKWYNEHNSETLDPRKIKKILQPPKNFRRNRWFGWLSDSVKPAYYDKLNIAWISKRLRRKHDIENKKVICPLCGENMYYNGNVVAMENIEDDEWLTPPSLIIWNDGS